MTKRVILAIGGNALGHTHSEQLEGAKLAASCAADLIQEGWSVVITHGNGPQLGILESVLKKLAETNAKAAEVPFSAKIAVTQAYIGGDIKNALNAEFEKRGMTGTETESIITEVLVDENDPAFCNPSKPIGEFMSKEEAEALFAKTGTAVMEDAGRGYRQAVASPKPLEILKIKEIREAADKRKVVITCGGAGIPVVKDGEGYRSVHAVIDKDYVSALLAEQLGADCLLIITGMEKVSINYRKPNETELGAITVCEAQKYIDDGQFAAGSMLPKMEAAAKFARSANGRKTIITNLENAVAAFKGETGTRIVSGTSAKGRFCLK